VLPNKKRQKESKEFFDEKGGKVNISKNCWNKQRLLEQAKVKMKLVALTIAYEVRQKQVSIVNNNIFHCNGQESNIRKDGKLFRRKKSDCNAKHTSKTRKQHHQHGP